MGNNMINPNNDDICPICYIDMKKNKKVLSCSHTFHSTCIDTWTSSNPTCPLCRASIIKEQSLSTPTPIPISILHIKLLILIFYIIFLISDSVYMYFIYKSYDFITMDNSTGTPIMLVNNFDFIISFHSIVHIIHILNIIVIFKYFISIDKFILMTFAGILMFDIILSRPIIKNINNNDFKLHFIILLLLSYFFHIIYIIFKKYMIYKYSEHIKYKKYILICKGDCI